MPTVHATRWLLSVSGITKKCTGTCAADVRRQRGGDREWALGIRREVDADAELEL
jgi:hypothetical protein